ncbi:hypothetical protein HDU81_001146 [Chytriomyces hyalinus]|nr:hypothetical protein HDU81_001146 [Chytriomyces hyalinus]
MHAFTAASIFLAALALLPIHSFAADANPATAATPSNWDANYRSTTTHPTGNTKTRKQKHSKTRTSSSIATKTPSSPRPVVARDDDEKPRIVIYTNELSDALLYTKYTHINVNFWNREYHDDWYLDPSALQEAGKKVLISAYGAGVTPTTNGDDAVEDARMLAEFVQRNGLDGVDIDWEDGPSLGNGGEEWLITLTRELRSQLPSPQYLITHAPQGPHFSPDLYGGGAYVTVDQEAGNLIDFYNVQYYNQGSSSYDDCDCLLFNSGGWAPQTSVFEIHDALGIPLNKIVIGKPVTQDGVDDGSTGYMDPSGLIECFRQAGEQGWNAGGMGWRFGLDMDGTWAEQLSEALGI